jgi:xanthine/uracil/vitamin C permease (AzgA family)
VELARLVRSRARRQVERRRRCCTEDTVMIVLAHIMGMPVEEVLLPLASGAGTGTMLWLAALLRKRRDEIAKR